MSHGRVNVDDALRLIDADGDGGRRATTARSARPLQEDAPPRRDAVTRRPHDRTAISDAASTTVRSSARRTPRRVSWNGPNADGDDWPDEFDACATRPGRRAAARCRQRRGQRTPSTTARRHERDQVDLDGDALGDACDADDDGDGRVDARRPTARRLRATSGCPSPPARPGRQRRRRHLQRLRRLPVRVREDHQRLPAAVASPSLSARAQAPRQAQRHDLGPHQPRRDGRGHDPAQVCKRKRCRWVRVTRKTPARSPAAATVTATQLGAAATAPSSCSPAAPAAPRPRPSSFRVR